MPNSKDLPSSLVQLRIAVWTGATRDTRPRAAVVGQFVLRAARFLFDHRVGARESGLRYDSAYSDLGVRDAEITAHAAFRRRLYDHDVGPDAQAAAALMGLPG